MYAVGRLGSYISRGVYTVSGPFHPFGGAVDIIVVQQPDGSFKSSPWYVRFGKFQGVLKTKEKVVSINVNGVDASFHMYLDHKGEAYFLSEVEEEGEDGQATLFPSSSSSDDTDGQSNRRPLKSKSCNYDASRSDIAGRAGSRRQRILGLVFGRRSLKEDSLGAKGEDGPGVGRVDSLERAEIAADLLDLNWSTSLATKKQRKDGRSRFLTRNAFDNEAKEVSNDKIGQESDNDLSMESSPGDALIHLSSLCTEGVVEIPLLDERVEKACALTPEKSESYKNNLDWDEKEVVVGTAYKEMDELCAEEITVDLPEYGFSEESQLERVQSSGNCETSESSHRDLQLHASCDQYSGKLYLANGGEEARETHLETITVKTEMLSEDTSTGQQCGNNELHTKQEGVPEVTLLHSMVYEQSELLLEEPLTEVSSEQNVHTEETSPSLYSIPASGDKHYEANEEERIRDDANGPFNLETSCDTKSFVGDCDLSKPTSAPASESSDDVQFLFSDLDDSKLNELMRQEGKLNDLVNEEVNDCFRHGATALSDADERSDASVDNLGEEITLANAEDTNKEIKSSPITITRNYTLDNEEVERLVESMPPMRSEIDNLDSYLVQVPLSQSLDTTSKSLEFPKDEACSTKSNGHAEEHLTSGQIDVGDADGLVPAENIHVSPSVEISLCRHMLYEGMGADAAAKAFDAEKLDINRFESLGPTVVKNDRLVVRIKGRYFPWNAAAPIILGMVSFGSKLIPEPKGMIAVDKVERALEADSSKEVGPTPGNWRIWPFSFKKSRSGKVIHDARAFSDEKALESTTSQNADKGPLKPRVMKKMVRVLTPTSDQLASLNLKEGSNSVTFTFSTAMLGNQRVDARIYLWKWNTRIIISDVDGTITKSDVLGQFMPLVGMDWSQTGVAHLFSAIKENGYQMLFLSARAISQAYHTRQFLFNLKQDGKCLPDGPVVISPDGLFPSLYREVIRRAPHEFKIACLEDIKALFPPGCNPFYAGFGNRDTDEISYLKVGIPKGKIFTINPKGEVAVNRHINTKSYSSLHALVHGMFPSLSASTSTTHEQEDYNTWNYWKLPPPDIDI